MNLDSSTIDRIVAGVLNQLGAVDNGSREDFNAESRSRGGRVEDSVSREATPSAGGTVIAANVVTADVLFAEMKGQQFIVVKDRAIVTPAALDAARERGVVIVRSNAASHANSNKAAPTEKLSSGSSPLLIVVRHTDALDRLSEDALSSWQHETLGCPDDAASLAISTICRGDAGTVVILAEQTHRAACLANRNERVKAVAVADASDVRRVRNQLRANVWCIDPTDRSWFELRNLLKTIS
ncbi:MAG: hypothetical protein KDA93_01150 [Planctomycetaceae bacterium]|nr:hypothetical protein [Planctomycetaceae bacterium]